MPELQKPFKELEFRASELGHFRAVLRTAQHCQERDQQDLDQIVANVVGSGIGNALERGQEELHRRPPRITGSPLKNLEVYARSRTRSQPLAPPVNATSHKP